MRRDFRKGDSVIVTERGGKKRQAEVLATDRICKYGHSVVVLVEKRDIGLYTENGTRFFGDETITLGRL